MSKAKVAPKPIPEKLLTHAQRRHLDARIDEAKRHAPPYYRSSSRTPEPAKIKAYREAIKEWERAQDRAHDARVLEYDVLVRAAREAVQFGEPAAALAAVQKLEALTDERRAQGKD